MGRKSKLIRLILGHGIGLKLLDKSPHPNHVVVVIVVAIISVMQVAYQVAQLIGYRYRKE